MAHERVKFGVVACATIASAILIWTQTRTEDRNSDTKGSPVVERTPKVSPEGASPHDPGVCTLSITATAVGHGVLSGVEHCAYDLLSGRRIGCETSDNEGKTVVEWECTEPRQIVLSSASPDWVATRTRLVSPAPNQPESLHVRLARAELYLSGRVEDALGGPVGGAFVRVHCRETRVQAGSLAFIGLGVTEDDGVFRSGVPKSCEVDSLVASATGYAAATHFLEHQRDGIVIRLLPAGVIRGQVTNEDGAVPNPVVVLREADGFDFLPAAERSARTNERGEFVFEGVPPGLWVVTASADGEFGAYPSPIRLDLGGLREGVEIKLHQGLAVDVVVSDALADACTGGRVEIISNGTPLQTVATFEVDEAETLRARGLQHRQLTAVLKCEGYASIVSAPLHEIGHHWEPTLPEGSSISGQVVDAEGSAVAGAGIWVEALEQFGPAPSSHSDETGRFTIRGLTTGSATLFARATSSSPRASMQILIEGEGLNDLIVSLPASTEARGKVVTSGGKGAGAYRVKVTTPTASCNAASDESGAFSCWLDAAEELLNYQVTDHQRAIVGTAEAPVGQIVEIEIPTWTISGMVTSAEEGPYTVAAEAVVDGRRVRGPIGVATEPNGDFELSGLSIGVSYWLTVQSLSGNTASVGPFFEGDRAALELPELAQVQVLAPCSGEVGELRILQGKSSPAPLLAVPITVSPEGKLGTFEVPAGEWYVELSVGVGAPVGISVTLTPGATQTVHFESCVEVPVP